VFGCLMAARGVNELEAPVSDDAGLFAFRREAASTQDFVIGHHSQPSRATRLQDSMHFQLSHADGRCWVLVLFQLERLRADTRAAP
jgi:hypothetical protein